MGRSVSSFGTSSVVVNRTITANADINSGERIFANATAGGFTLTLPATPVDGDTIQIIDVAGICATNNINIGRNGNKIQNISEDLVMNLNNAALTMIYSGSTFGWVFVGP
jgi:hypothetical protein